MTGRYHRLDELLGRFRSKGPEATVAVTESGEPVGIAAFDALVVDTVRWFTANGIGTGDRVAVWLPNRLEWLVLLFAMARTGVTLVAVNTRYRATEVAFILNASKASWLLMQPGFRRIHFAEILDGIDPSDLPYLQRVGVLSGDGDTAAPESVLGRPVIPFDVGQEGARPENASADVASDPNSDLAFFTTSGTTKSPKLVVHSQHTLSLHSARVAGAFGFDAEDAGFFAVMPFCGVFGLNAVLGAVAGGAPVHIAGAFDADSAARRIRRHRLTHLIGSDELVARLLEQEPGCLSSLRVCGFAAFTPGLGATLRRAAENGMPLSGLYGSSEVNALFSLQSISLPVEERLKGGGRTTSGDAVVRVTDGETGALVPMGEVGALEIKAPTSFTGYYDNPEATADAMTSDGFFRTGDIGYLRDDGSFVYVARAGDAIRLSGFLVDPAEIEDVLKTLTGISDAQVVGVDLDGRIKPVAFVIPSRSGHVDEEAIRTAAAAVLAPFKVPVRIFPVEIFPVTESANGQKIQKAKLRQMAADRLAGSTARTG